MSLVRDLREIWWNTGSSLGKGHCTVLRQDIVTHSALIPTTQVGEWGTQVIYSNPQIN